MKFTSRESRQRTKENLRHVITADRLPEQEIMPHLKSGSEQGTRTSSRNTSSSSVFLQLRNCLRTMRQGLRSRTNGTPKRDSLQKSDDSAISTAIETVERTDYSRWRLQVKHGRQTWTYIDPSQVPTWPQSIPEKYHLGLETVSPPPTVHSLTVVGSA